MPFPACILIKIRKSASVKKSRMKALFKSALVAPCSVRPIKAIEETVTEKDML